MEQTEQPQQQEQEFEQLREYRAWDSYNHKMVMNPFQFHTLKNGVNELRTRCNCLSGMQSLYSLQESLTRMETKYLKVTSFAL